MILKRLYIKGRRYPYRYKPSIQSYHELMEYAAANPDENVHSLDNATYFFTDLSHEEQNSMWMNSIKNIMFNTRWVLDNLDKVCEYKTRWNNYGFRYGRITVGCPPEVLTKVCNDRYNFYKQDRGVL